MRAVAIRDRRDALLVGPYGLGMAIQAQAMLLSGEQVRGSVWTESIFTAFLQRVVDSSMLGLELAGSTWADWGWPLLIATSAAVAVCLVTMLLQAPSSRFFAVIAIVTSVAMFLVSGYARALGDELAWPADSYYTFGGRYAMVPTLLLIGAALALIDSRYRSSRGRLLATIATIAVLLVPLVTSFDVSGDLGRGGTPWDESLSTSAARCEAQSLAEVPVATSPEGWALTVPCDRLTSAGGSGQRQSQPAP